MTRYEAHIEKNWSQHGLAQLIVARIRENGLADCGAFLVDSYCLGVKEAIFAADLSSAAREDMIAACLPEEQRESIHPACAKKLVEGAVAYAASLGFDPARDFRKARRVLSGLDAALCPTVFTFGRDGRPCYVQGPNDTPERVERVLALLEARCGPDGFNYLLADAADETEEDIQAMRESLMVWLEAEPDSVPRFHYLAGMVAALHVCPGMVPPTKLFGVFWGPEGRVWKDNHEAQNFISLLQTYWNYVGNLMHDAVAPDAHPDDPVLDLWQEDFPEDNAPEYAVAAVDWAAGFLRTVELWPEAWAGAAQRADLAPHWEILRVWSDLEAKEARPRIQAAAKGDPLSPLATAVKALFRALRSPGAGPAS